MAPGEGVGPENRLSLFMWTIGIEVFSLGKWVWAELCLKEFISSAQVSLESFGLNGTVARVGPGDFQFLGEQRRGHYALFAEWVSIAADKKMLV